MSVLVVNERDSPFRWTSGKRGQNDKLLLPGETAVLTEAEWEEVPISLRQAGGLRALSPGPSEEDLVDTTELDYYTVGSGPSVELRYLGEAEQGSAATDPVWTVKRFAHSEVIPGDVRITEIQVLRNVPWGLTQADRDGLGWA